MLWVYVKGQLSSLPHKTAEAIALLKKVLAVDANHAAAKKTLGTHYFKRSRKALDRGKYKAAVDNGRIAVRYVPELADAWMALGFALEQLKQKDEARTALQKYLQLCPKCRWSNFVKQSLARLNK